MSAVFITQPIPWERTGKVGVLFPGEGSQFPGMLSDLAEAFPHVRAILDHCDELNASSAHPEKSIGRFFQDPDTQTEEERNEVEEDLKRLDFAMFTVFIGDWIMHSILEHLKVKSDTICGHSGGELVALMAAHVLTGSEEQFARLGEGFRQLGKFTPKDTVDSKLIALGTSAEKAQSIIDQASRENGRQLQAFVAMLNCPHQTVIVGTRSDIEVVENVISKKGMLYQHLDLETTLSHTAV